MAGEENKQYINRVHKLAVDRYSNSMILMHLNKGESMIDDILDEYGIKDDMVRMKYRRLFTSMISNIQSCWSNCVQVDPHMESENKQAEVRYKMYDSKQQHENEEKIKLLLDKLKRVNMMRNQIDSTLKQVLNSKVNRLISTYNDNNNILVHINNSNLILDIDHFIKHKIKRIQSDSNMYTNRLLAIKDSFDHMKHQCIEIYKHISQRISHIEYVKSSQFDEPELYEIILSYM